MDVPAWFPETIGGVAAVCTTVAFAPQLLRVWRLKRADEISLATFALFSVGTVLWTTYGFLIDSLPVILANGSTVVLAVAILALKLKWDRGRDASPT